MGSFAGWPLFDTGLIMGLAEKKRDQMILYYNRPLISYISPSNLAKASTDAIYDNVSAFFFVGLAMAIFHQLYCRYSLDGNFHGKRFTIWPTLELTRARNFSSTGWLDIL